MEVQCARGVACGSDLSSFQSLIEKGAIVGRKCVVFAGARLLPSYNNEMLVFHPIGESRPRGGCKSHIPHATMDLL